MRAMPKTGTAMCWPADVETPAVVGEEATATASLPPSINLSCN